MSKSKPCSVLPLKACAPRIGRRPKRFDARPVRSRHAAWDHSRAAQSYRQRSPADQVWTLDELEGKGLFAHTRSHGEGAIDNTDAELHHLLESHDYTAFLKLAVRSRKNILVSGPTGSGKTTCTKALILEIPPDERLITIEDARELVLDKHPNHVRLYHSKDGQGQSHITPKQLLEATLRMRPDRILLAELRGEEAFDYLRNVNSGHPGSITSIHAGSPELALEQLMLLIKESKAGRELPRADIHQLLRATIDVMIRFEVANHRRQIREIALLEHCELRRS